MATLLQDSVAFLRGFLAQHPRFKGRPFYLAGESYGGHYVPELAHAILAHNAGFQSAAQQAGHGSAAGSAGADAAGEAAKLLRAPGLDAPGAVSDRSAEGDASRSARLRKRSDAGTGSSRGSDGTPDINLQGFMVGNAWTDPATENRGAADFWYSHALISNATHHAIMQACDFGSIGPLQGAQEVHSPAWCHYATTKTVIIIMLNREFRRSLGGHAIMLVCVERTLHARLYGGLDCPAKSDVEHHHCLNRLCRARPARCTGLEAPPPPPPPAKGVQRSVGRRDAGQQHAQHLRHLRRCVLPCARP